MCLIVDLPVVKISPPHAGGYLGSVINLHCSVTGFPIPNISWLYKGASTLPPGVTARQARVTIELNQKTRGQYTCQAQNSLGTTSVNAIIRLYGKLHCLVSINFSHVD